MKKILAVTLALLMLLAFAACGSSESAPTAETVAEPAAEEASPAEEAAPAEEPAGAVYNVGIIQLVEHVALDAATQGFEDALTDRLGDSVVFDENDAQGESANCATIANSLVSAGVDLILATATAPLPLPTRSPCWEPPSPTLPRPLISTIGTEPPAATFPAPPTLRPWTVRPRS